MDKDYDKERLTIKHASEVITNNEVPTKAIKKKTDSSMVVGFNMLKNREGDVFVSAGSSGALLAGSVFILRRIRGISRPALGSIIPTKRGRIILLDSGLNSVIRPQNYLQFAYLGAAYMKSMFGVEDPRVGLVNVGTEEEKGTEAVKEANTLLRQSTLNYIGFIEGKDVFEGIADVVVTDGFTGNVMLKLIEGTATYFFREVKGVLLRNWKSRIGAAFLKKGFEDFKKSMDPDVNGGAPILGVDGLVIKSHGSSNARTIKHVILKAVTLAESDFISDIKKEIKNM
ncbi:MAG TPA: phosphate acyltransferase PlsX [Clostridia bacterium]|nr:phosphate acyltransferase PlsX [Clostridia bacterium]